MSVNSVSDAMSAVANWTSSDVSEATEKQNERARKLSEAKPARTPKPAKEAKPARNVKPKPAQEETSAQLRPVAPKRVINGQVRYCDAQSAARTSNAFIPARSTNYAAAARAHITALLKSASGRKTVDDVSALTASLVKSGIPADYIHAPHVRYWRKQVTGK